ncbi:HPr-rel-A system PqqD family peptide chaperone [Sphingomonas sp. NBWT7]|uniref:HPr-rel-A system PqqD family peptide chaperone n=1 Tax=Sphingomonas sp. NBWT7 TaxID=2596913 RepID=UPI0016231A22|nr:HPr-rel-A system PqqD family peptide chaperone [Sphingomonas sp. NBWT7]QNE31403.1 HPr-rel-A system PqqD family peptide chaperone [Sphingomonas sp. NBWT7]
MAGATRYRAPPADGLAIVALDDLTAVFHRASGITHLIAPTTLDLLDALGGRWLTLDAVEQTFELVEGGRTALLETLDALTVAGLIERA